MSALIQPVTLASFQAQVLDASREHPVVVDFWADWCGPCKALAPVLEKLARDLGDQVRIVKVDTDAEPQLAGQFHIRSVPTVMLFRDGRLASQFVGAQPEGAIREWLRPFLPPPTADLRRQAAGARAAGHTAEARRLLEQALEQATNDHESRLDLAELELAEGNAGAALAHLRALPVDQATEPRALALNARLEFVAELESLGDAASDLDQLYAEGLRDVAAGRLEAAAEAFLTLTARSRAYRDDAGRRSLLRLFDLLGPDHPQVPTWRRRLSQLLH
jgi:putative thioredoxin